MRTFERRATRAALLLLVVVTAACSALRPNGRDAALRVGVSGDYPPFAVRAADGTNRGFDVEVARAYAAATGRQLELVPFRWPDLAGAIAAGTFDVAMSGVTVRGDRLLVGRMTAAVARADAVLLARRGERPLRAVGRGRVAVNRGGHLERVARARLPHAELVVVDDNRSLPRLLASREVDAVVTDTLEAATFPLDFEIATTLARDRKAYWTAPGRDALADDLDAWLLARERDGTLGRLRAAHLPGARVSELPPEIERVVDLAARRLMLMPQVAAAKRAAGLPIVDAAREAAVVAGAVERARAAGLDAGAAERLARAQIGAARAVQEQDRGVAGASAPSLAAVRSGIDALDGALLRALVTARAAALPATGRPALAKALRRDADLPGFDEAHAGAIAAAIADVVRPAP